MNEVSSNNNKNKRFLNTKIGFFILSIIFMWIKTYWVYKFKFNLGAKGIIQQFLELFNPIPAAIILLGIALYFKGKKSYYMMIFINFLQSLWLFSNILYYKEFSDFLSFAIMGSESSVGHNLSKAIVGSITPDDFLVFADVIIVVILLLFKIIKVDSNNIKKSKAFNITLLGFALMFAGYGVSASNRPGLLTRTFDNNYIVKYLGIDEYLVYNGVKTEITSNQRAIAKPSELKPIEKFVKTLHTTPNPEYYGSLKGDNIIVIHLESFQQFLIGYKVDGRLVTPNLDKFYHLKNTLSFDNFYNQVGQGKTSDAETMLDNSLYGLPSGSVMTNYGTSNTFQSFEGYLDHKGYTTSVFHGDVPSFWNRESTYKSWGINYFISKGYFNNSSNPANNVGYGLKDKLFLKGTAKYMQKLPQPFFAKVITLTNHYPYTLDKKDIDFPATKTGDKTVDGYVQTAHYLDEAFGQFMNWYYKSGMYKKSALVLYGDHYGISQNHKPAIAKLLGKKSLSSLTNYDLANWQKVPFMINAPGLKGGINNTYGGEIDVMPTLMDMLGIPYNNSIHFGTDLLSAEHKQIVAFRDGDWISNKYAKYNGQFFETPNGKQINVNEETPIEKDTIKDTQSYVDNSLDDSDKVITGDLLRFYHNNSFKPIDRKNYSYNMKKALAKLKQQQKEGTSLIAENHVKNTMNFYTNNDVMENEPNSVNDTVKNLNN